MDALFTNTLGLRMIRIESGSFLMGQADGDLDERPVHPVRITRAFHLAATPVTNAQYEQFDGRHRGFRGRRGLSAGDNEAALFVTWHDAVAFCRWLSDHEGRPYRLPTEAEWEYACRAGTTTAYSTGEMLSDVYHRDQKDDWHPRPVDLTVGRTPANPWGLHDMHGLVEEWCSDWYGRYEAEEQIDPVGRVMGLFRLTRGGSHNTGLEQLRSANRAGTLPEDCHWLIGFRVVAAEELTTEPLPAERPKLWAINVAQPVATKTIHVAQPPSAAPAKQDSPSAAPFFLPPIVFVRPPADPDSVPIYPHNHCPSITWCDNGDLLAAWFSTRSEFGREMTVLAARLRRGADQWDEAAEFFKAPDRNMTGTSLFNDGTGTLYHFNGLEAGGLWRNLALVMRTSVDHGATWSTPRLINPEHQARNQVISGTKRTREGCFIQPCDGVHDAAGGTAIHVSRDGGRTWVDPGAGTPSPNFVVGGTGGSIAGIHAGVEQLADGSLLALGRTCDLPAADAAVGLRMPASRSADMGASWTYQPSPFPPIYNGQRLALLRLREGPLLLASFTDSSLKLDHPEGMLITDAAGRLLRIFGLFVALSFDEGATWPAIRPVTMPGAARQLEGGAWTGAFTFDATHGEPRGYLAITQSPDFTIHLISSRLHYRFNLAWARGPMENAM
jgi:formylglycine-generating enzyme required for sulfatase activity